MIFAAPREGYRGWHGVICLSSASHNRSSDLAYDYMYWWLSGWAGAFIARQGYYILTPQGCAPFMGQGEWDYWYDGKPPSVPLYCTDGFTSVLASKVLTGGSDNQRFSNVAVWNTAMPTYDYSIHKSYEFISS